MTQGKALIAAAVFPVLLVVVVVLLLVPRDGNDGRTVHAELQDVALLAEGHDVRVRGTTVGAVRGLELTDRGTVLVTMVLQDGAPAPKADATASLRATDLLGDVYMALEPGRSSRPLGRTIPVTRTFNATRVQDLFDVFDGPTRIALQSLLVEVGRALEARGTDLNAATLQLAPVLAETERVAQQLGRQDADLDRLVTSTRRLTRQLAPRTADLQRLIGAFDRTFSLTSRRTQELDRGLGRLPATLVAARRTLAGLERTSGAATPLARTLGAVAGPVAEAVSATSPFTGDARQALAAVRPLVREAEVTFRGSRRSLPRLERALQATRAAAPDVNAFVELFRPLVQYAVEGAARSLSGIAGEPGGRGEKNPNQLTDEPYRNYFRVLAVLGCESLGMVTRPGCLTEAIDLAAGRPRTGDRRRPAVRRPSPQTSTPPAPSQDGERPHRPAAPGLPDGDDALEDLKDAIGQTADPVQDAIDDLQRELKRSEGLLDYLVGR